MKIQKNKLKKKKNIILIPIVLALVLIFLIFAFFANTWPFNSPELKKPSSESNEVKTNQINLDEPTKEQIDAGKEIKKDTIQPEDDDSFDAIIIDITQSGNNLLVSTLIQYITDEGICRLTITDGNNVFDAVAGTAAMPTTSSCKDFGIAINDTGLRFGKWQFKLSVTIDGKTSIFETEKIIEKI